MNLIVAAMFSFLKQLYYIGKFKLSGSGDLPCGPEAIVDPANKVEESPYKTGCEGWKIL